MKILGQVLSSKFGSSSNWSVRKEVAKALSNYKDSLSNEWLVKLNTDTDGDVRKEALKVISGRNVDLGSYNISGLINSSNWQSRRGLANALLYVTGVGADNALLRLSADTDGDVRKAAYKTLSNRPVSSNQMNIANLINSSNWQSRRGCYQSLKIRK